MRRGRHHLVLLAILALASAAAANGFPLAEASAAADPPTARVEPALWDSLQALEDRLAWAAEESLGTAIARRLEAAPAMDSLDYSRALLGVATGRLRRRLLADGQGFTALETALGIRQRHAPAGDPLRAKAHWLAAVFYAEAGQPERARIHGEAGVRVAGQGSPLDTLHLSRIHVALAGTLAGLGRLDEARRNHERALVLREGKFGRTHRTLVPTLAEFGAFLSRQGEFDDARVLLMRALAIAERDTAPNSDLLEGTLSRLSSLEDRAGNLGESIEYAYRALEQTRSRRGDDDVQTVRMRTLVAYRLEEVGDPAGASAQLAQVVPLLDARLGATNPQTINARLVWIENLEAIGDTAAARRELAAVVPALAGQEELFNENRAHLLVLQANLALARGDRAAGQESLAAAIRHEEAKRDPLGETLAAVVAHQLDTFRGPEDRARVVAARADVEFLRDSTRVLRNPAWTEALLALARAEARAGLVDDAWAHALDAEERVRARFRAEVRVLPDQRALQLGQHLGKASEVLVRLAAAGGADRVETAWDRVVQWRGLVGSEVARRRAPASAAADTALLAAHRRWVAAQRRLAQWVVGGVASPDDPATSVRYEAARHEAEEAERAWLRRAPSGAPAVAGDGATLAGVRERLGAGQALVAFAVGSIDSFDAELGAFVARGGRSEPPRWVPLGPVADAEREIRAWTASLAAAPTSAAAIRSAGTRTRTLGRAVRARLWDPIERAVGDARTLFVVPEGAVFEVPWLALPTGDARYLADAPFVLDVLGAERELLEAHGARGGGLLAVGGPDFDGVPAPVAAPVLLATALRGAPPRPCTGGVGALKPLPGARAEVEDIARDWADGDARLLVGAEAGEAAVKAEAGGRGVLHLATHGVVLEDTCAVGWAGLRGVGGVEPVTAVRPPKARPRAKAAVGEPVRRAAPEWLRGRVWLALAGANRPLAEAADENEGLLTAEEVVTLDLRGTDWVVLSACQSGVAPTWSREGVLGMRRAFHLAGARAVIASQWPVADAATREWMSALYTARAGHPTAGAALREACRSVLAARRRDGRPTLPFYWAAFTSTGR